MKVTYKMLNSLLLLAIFLCISPTIQVPPPPTPTSVTISQIDCPLKNFFREARSLECEQMRTLLKLYESCKDAKDASGRTAAMFIAGNTQMTAHDSKTQRDYYDGKAAFCIQVLHAFDAVWVDTQDNGGNTAISWASANGMPNLLETLLTLPRKEDDNSKSELLETTEKVRRSTPLHAAVAHNHFEAASVLVEHGANVRAKDIDGQTPAMKAALNKRTDILGRLLTADPGAADDISLTEWTTCHFGVYAKSVEVISLLLSVHGCNLDAKDKDGHTPYILSTIVGAEDVAYLLREAKINAIEEDHKDWSSRRNDFEEM